MKDTHTNDSVQAVQLWDDQQDIVYNALTGHVQKQLDALTMTVTSPGSGWEQISKYNT